MTAPALTVWPAVQSEGEGSIDAGFIDANKNDYDLYYEQLLKLLRPGGLIMVDNVLWFCDVLDPNAQDADTKVGTAFACRSLASRPGST